MLMVINVNGERPPHGGKLRQAAGVAAAEGRLKAFDMAGRLHAECRLPRGSSKLITADANGDVVVTLGITPRHDGFGLIARIGRAT